ncbi:unnamed protein product [Phyllotreta striolata]|uniref:Uncharacterized protein n=1 Tax=Phyllotreta striolata TaxID=444603 RepID=A0A9N9XRY2_PHYSR|nr:unnamed protein product [Phyllotreta striolata]
MKYILILSFAVGLALAELPSYIKVCKKSNPDLAKCIINSVMSLKPKLAEGISELEVPPLEPLLLDTIKLRSGPSSAKIDANITNLLVYGASAFELPNLVPDVEKNRFLFKAVIPHIFFKGDYDIDMNVLILKYKGQGPLTGNFTDLTLEVLLRGKLININGVKHLNFRKIGMKLSHIGHAKLHLGNLFADQEGLGRATNEVVNENSDIFINEIKPNLEDALSEKFTEISNIICTKFTYDELFPN